MGRVSSNQALAGCGGSGLPRPFGCNLRKGSMKMERRTFLKLAALVPGLALAGCGGSKTLLSPKDPTMLSIWHVYGEQADSPMNRLLTEFNDTVGREKGILLNVTNMTNSAAKAGKPGALDLPDLFSEIGRAHV